MRYEVERCRLRLPRFDHCRIAAYVATLTLFSAIFFNLLPAQTTPEIAISIGATQSVYLKGEPIRIRVELRNLGRRDLLVGRQLSGVGMNPADVAFQVWNSEGHALPGESAAADCVMVANTDSLAVAVLKRWISLPPGSSYITSVGLSLPPSSLERPGRYRVLATYISGGIKEQYWSDCLKTTPEEIAKLPFPAWEGKADSNSIWIQIESPPAGKRPHS
jgi:hypothetical protein